MADLQDTIVVKKSLAEVFSYAANLENSPGILSNVVKVEKLTDGPIQVGTKYRETREIRGREATAVIEMIDYQEPDHYTVKSESNGLGVIYRYTFKEKGDDTEVSFTGNIQTRGIMMKLTKPFIRKILQKEDGSHLKELKKKVEEG